MAGKSRQIFFVVCCVIAACATIPRIDARSDSDLRSLYEDSRTHFRNFTVSSYEEFVRMVEYRDALLAEGRVLHQFTMDDGADCHCIDVYTQNSFIASGVAPENLTFAPITLPQDDPHKPESGTADMTGPFLDGKLDANGNLRKCPEGTIPRLIPRLEDLCSFKRLEDRYRKHPDSNGALPGRGSSSESFDRSAVHRYGAAYRSVNTIGSGADINLWSPFIENSNDELSIAQIWVARGDGSELQSVESGWICYPGYFPDNRARFFIFYTVNGYQTLGDNLGCYNADCVGFVQVDSSMALGGTFSSYSSEGGTQWYFTDEFYRDPSTGNWWLRINSEAWIGYYPSSLFDSAGIKNSADFIEYGGEVRDDMAGGVRTTTDMGSGKFPSAGFGRAAYLAVMHFWDLAGTYNHTSGCTKSAGDPNMYDIQILSSTQPAWREHIFFGGPGASQTEPSLELFYLDHPSTECFTSGDPFDGRYRILNSDPSDMNLDLYIALEYGNHWYFWPSWSEAVAKQNVMVPAGGEKTDTFMQFFWPSEVGTVNNLSFYSVTVDPGTINLRGNVASLTVCALGTGDISFQLNWTYEGAGEGPDLDLHATDPTGNHLYWGNKYSAGATLDFDDRGECAEGDGGGPENIFWGNGLAPRGNYTYSVNWFASCGSYTIANYTIIVKKDGIEADRKNGSLSAYQTASFEYTL